MSHTKCIVCLQKSTQIPSEYFQFSNRLLIKFLNSLSTKLNGFEFSSGNSFPFCSHCRVYLTKFAKLNDKLESLVGNLCRVEKQQTVKFRKIRSLQRRTLGNDNDIQNRLGDSWNDQQEDEQHVQIGLPNPEIFQTNILGTSEVDNIDIAEASDLIEIVDIVDDDSNVATNLTGSQTNGQPLLDNEDNSDKGASSAQTMGGEYVETLDQRAPRSPATKIFTNSVEQLSQKNFIYKAKYPFERTVSGFKCGSCQATSEVCKAKGSSEWNFIIGHIRRWHLDSDLTRKVSTSKKHINRKHSNSDSGLTPKVSTSKKAATQKCKEAVEQVSEKKFIYKGKYPFEQTDFGFKCGTCAAKSEFSKSRGSLWFNIIRHINEWHYDSDRVRKLKVHQRLIEIAPDRFQYGTYLIEKEDNKYRCVTCGHLASFGLGKKKFEPIRQHIFYKHENPGRHMCEVCGVQLSCSKALKIHKITKHDQSNSSYPCSKCEKTFKTQLQLHLHERGVHSGRDFNFICEICGQKFRVKQHLQEHIGFVHNGERKFKCNDCGKAYGNSRSLEVHQNSHTGRRKYACDVCGMNFSQSYSVTRHKMTAHKN